MVTRKPKVKPTEPPTVHLWTAADISHWREKLSKEQKGIDPITGEAFHGRLTLDHDHHKDSQRVRGVLSSASNVFEGKVKAVFHRYLKYATKQPLNIILRNLASYYERDNSHLPLHTSWVKTVQSAFSSLPEPQKAKVLKELGKENGGNSLARKKIFLDVLKGKKLSYTQCMELINKHKPSKE